MYFWWLGSVSFQLPFLYKAGVLVKPSWGWKTPGVQKIKRLLIPALFGVSVTQINLLLDTLIASFLVSGSISWLYYADRLLEFPLGVFGIGIATVILPTLSRLHTSKGTQEFNDTMDWGLKFVLFMGLPALAGLMVLAQPIVSVLFMRGAFTAYDVAQVSYALFAYLSGLVSFMLIKIFAPGYYARQDTKTPVKIGIIAMVANMVLNLMLAPILGYVGLALATTLSGTLNAILLYRGLHKSSVFTLSKATLLFALKLVVSAALMAAVVYHFSPAFEQWLTFTFARKVSLLVGLILLGVTVYFVLALLLGVRLSDFKVQTTRSESEQV